MRKNHARRRLAMLGATVLDGGLASTGYKSGRRSDRGTPDNPSSSNTRVGGTPARRHLLTACGDIPADFATASSPTAERARSTAGLESMTGSQPQVEMVVNLRSVAGINLRFHHFRMSPLGKVITGQLGHLRQSQAWLAERAEVSENAVSKWVRTGKISRANAENVASILNMSLDQLLGRSSEGRSDPDAEWRKLSPTLKAKLIAMVNEIREISEDGEVPKAATKIAHGR